MCLPEDHVLPQIFPRIQRCAATYTYIYMYDEKSYTAPLETQFVFPFPKVCVCVCLLLYRRRTQRVCEHLAQALNPITTNRGPLTLRDVARGDLRACGLRTFHTCITRVLQFIGQACFLYSRTYSYERPVLYGVRVRANRRYTFEFKTLIRGENFVTLFLRSVLANHQSPTWRKMTKSTCDSSRIV